MEVKGDLNIDGILTVNGVPVGASGVTSVTETDGNPPAFTPSSIIFNSNDFYLTPNSSSQPIINFRGTASSGGPGVTDHGALTGLLDDDHPQYARKAASQVTFDGAVIAEAFYVANGELSSDGSVALLDGPNGVTIRAHGGPITLFGQSPNPDTFQGPSPDINLQTDVAIGGNSGSFSFFSGSTSGGGTGSFVVSIGSAGEDNPGGSIQMSAGASDQGQGGEVFIQSGTSSVDDLDGDIRFLSAKDIILGFNRNLEIVGTIDNSVHIGEAIATFYIEAQKIQFNGQRLQNIGGPVNNDDAATKAYVDANSGGSSNIVTAEAFYLRSGANISSAPNPDAGDIRIESGGDVGEVRIEAFNVVVIANGGQLDLESTGLLTINSPSGVSLNGAVLQNLDTPVVSTDAATKGYVDGLVSGGSASPGFYGIVWSDANVTKRTDRLSFGAGFYLDGRKPTLNLVNNGLNITDDIHSFRNKGTIGLNSSGFYLSQNAAGNPVVNLRYDKDIYPIYVDFPTTQQIAVDPCAQYAYTIEKVDFDCFSGSATGGFYIVPRAFRSTYRDGIQVAGLSNMAINQTLTSSYATGANTVNPGDIVQLSVFQNSSARRVRVVLTCKKP